MAARPVLSSSAFMGFFSFKPIINEDDQYEFFF
jgi:hypothetical protein